MIDKIVELRRAVVTEALYGESNRRVGVDQDAGVTVMPCSEKTRRPTTGPGGFGSVCRESDCWVPWPFAWRWQ